MKRPALIILSTVLLLLLAACGTAGPVNYDTEQQPANDSQETGVVESATAALPDDEQTSPVEAEAADDVEPVAAVVAPEIDENSLDTHGEVQVGFTMEGHPFRGNPDASVVMEEFSDFQCPYCARFFQQTLSGLDESHIASGDVLFVFKDFPLESIHPQAFAAANAARCAGDQGAIAYWEMHDMLFERGEQWAVSDPGPVFAQYADELGLDAEPFTSCIENVEHAEKIRADIDAGQARGVRSTPSFFLNNQALVGAQPLQVFNQAIAVIQSGESIASDEPAPPIEEEPPLRPPSVAPTPAAIAAADEAYRMGDPDAPVTIVEYTDYQCPFCQRHSLETMPAILETLVETGRVQYVLKDLPLDRIHPEARTAALVARCAGEQDAYWPVHDAFFANQADWAGKGEAAVDILIGLTTELDLDEDALRACVEEDRYADLIQQNVDEANTLGANATPYFFVDGLPIPGAQPFDIFVYAVGLAEEGILAQAYESGQPDISGAYALGDPNAPVTIVEFTDYQCPFCQRHASQTLAQIKDNYIDKGLVYYVFKDFPLTNIHPQAIKAAEAARCAGDQNAYEAMHDKLFANQSEWAGNSNASDIFVSYAEDLSLDVATFTSCLQGGQHESAVMADFEEGAQLGINGTPAFFINNHSMDGAQPYTVFEQAIEQFLAEG